MKHNNTQTALSPIRFGKVIRFLYPIFNYHKPHKGGNVPNKYAYQGLTLKTDKINKLLQEPIPEQSELSVPELIKSLIDAKLFPVDVNVDVKP